MSTPRTVVGRERELAELDRRLTRSAGGCVAVVGEAGIGKSTLVAALQERLGPVALGCATEPPAPALRPLVEIAVAAIRHGADPDAPVLRVHRRVLAALLPGLVAGAAEAVALHPVVLADTLCRLLDTLPQAGRPVLVVEDLHWADADSLAAVEALIERTAADGARLLVTLRPEGPAWERMARLGERRVVPLVELGPLPDAAVRSLLACRLGCGPDDVPAGVLAVVAPAEGRPLWIEEIVETAISDGSLRRADGSWHCVDPGRIIPRTLSAAVARRLDDLGSARRVLECAALLGPCPAPPLIAAALGRGADEVAAALHAGSPAGLLTESKSEFGDGVLRFRHELLRGAVLDAMPRPRRRAAAQLLLDAVGPPGPDQLDLAAALACHAEQPAAAAELMLRAARRDLDRGLPGAAAQTLDQALAQAPAALRLRIRELRVLAQALAGDTDVALTEAGPVDAELAELPGTLDRRRSLGEAMVRATAAQGRWADAEHLVGDLRERFPDAATTAALAALVALERGRFAAAEAAARAALASGDTDAAARCEAMEVLGRLARRADLAAAELWFRRAVAAAESGGLALWRARALHELATIAQMRSYDLAPMRQARAAAVDAGAPGLVATVDFQIAAVHGVRFEPDLALPQARLMLDTARRLGARRQEAFAWVLIGQAHATAGRRAEAQRAGDEAVRLAPDDLEISGLSQVVCRGLPALLADDLPAALAHWGLAIDDLRAMGDTKPYPPWFLWPVLATVLDPTGDGGARARAETDVGELRVVPGADAAWHLADAVACGRRGDRGAATAALARADRQFAAVPAFAGYEHLARRLAAAAALADGWADPSGWLLGAEEWAVAHHHPGLARAARSLAGRAGVRRRRAGRGDAAVPQHLARMGVTSREMDVLLLVAEGLTNKEVAERLYLAPRTVKGHVELLLAKTGAANRTQLATRLRGSRSAAP